MLLGESFVLRNEKVKNAKLFLNKIVALKKDVFLIYFLIKFPDETQKKDESEIFYECDDDLIKELAANLTEDLGVQVSAFSRSATYEKNNLIFALNGILNAHCLLKLSKMKPINFLVKEVNIKNYDYYSKFKEKKEKSLNQKNKKRRK